MDYGNVPEWVEASATTLGFGWGLILFGRRLSRDKRTAARSVYYHLVDASPDPRLAVKGIREPQNRVVEVENLGKSPIYRLSAWGPRRNQVGVTLPLLKSGTSHKFSLKPNDEVSSKEDAMIRFRDPWGFEWTLDGLGKLKKKRKLRWQ